ncbi:hypothetical protein V8B55DRAFT_1504155 [Mucor lusitanicus]|uniref:Uncharacterized protein n=2 Tax=Mucor circinelloides f. lusitanicus TaxID=29924 RepID=A0A168Q8H8_MUCCL|nr:hypothetical protein FB192DRAFT_1367381 [Mucor lusitanicus]OAD08864.1 hypothetical protein MUCCIDRAFT_105832 [Mucor lusitanicus CBS 277.49]
MSDLNWCTFCDTAISPLSKSLYCSDQCLRADALRNHPLLGYTYPECTHFLARRRHHYHFTANATHPNHCHLPPRMIPTITRHIAIPLPKH